jgi:hypothetical protein
MSEKEKTAAELAEEAVAGGGDDGTFSREDLRKLFADLGWNIDLPATLSDLEAIGKALREAEAEYDKIIAGQALGDDTWGRDAAGNALTGPYTNPAIATLGKIYNLKEKLYAYAGQYFGSQGQTVVSRTLRPPVPEVAKLPTPEEFLGGYEEAFATHVEGLGLSAEEKKFAYDVMRNETYQAYMAKLGGFAKAGLSPFTLKEVSREERGVGAGTEAGAALDKALGPGVTEPTTITGTGEEVSKAMDAAGQGVPREFTTVPRLTPSDFLAGLLSPIAIKTAFAGSTEGAGRTARRVPAGFTANPKRV